MALTRIVVAEDDSSIRELIVHHLSREGYRCQEAVDGPSALRAARGGADLMILDVGLPVLDGFEVVRRLRREGRDLPIVVLTARTEEIDRVVGLEIGADDYVSKPFSPRELAARIKAILRRADHRDPGEVLVSGPIQLRRDERDVTVDGDLVELTSKEFDLLACFLEHPGIVLSRERLLDLVWGMTYPGGTRTVDVHVAQLRRKIGNPESIRTVRGSGYKLVAA